MTTVAYKNGILAADGKATRGDLVLTLSHRKLFRLKDGSIAAVTGVPGEAAPWLAWSRAGGAGVPPPMGGDGRIVHLRNDGTLRVYEGGGWEDEDPKLAHSWGSGWQIAATAMACGKSAREAVEIATRMDVWSGGKITAMQLRGITQQQADAAVRFVRRRRPA